VLGCGVTESDTFAMLMGTSSCHLLIAEREVTVPGISGVVQDGILPGAYAYEAGQAAVGDSLTWFLDKFAATGAAREAIVERAAALEPGSHGLVAVDWLNGCRFPHGDADLSGIVAGLTLRTRPEHLYRALIEGTAFGAASIAAAFEQSGMPIRRAVASGGLTRQPATMQIYADILGVPIAVPDEPQACALGAATLASASALSRRGSLLLKERVKAMTSTASRWYRPNPAHRAAYSALKSIYRDITTAFSVSRDSLQSLAALTRQTQGALQRE
jgi:L-ribulokinase